MNEDTLVKIFRVVPDIVFCLKDAALVYRAANPAFVLRLGLKSEDELLGKRAEDFFPAELAKVYREQDEEVLESRVEITDRLELVTNRDGSLGWYLASKFPLFDEKGKVSGLVAISRDLQTPSDSDLKMAGLKKVVDWLHDHLDEEVQTQDLAAIAAMTPTQLERRMAKVFQLGVAQFVRKMRIERAELLLRESDQSIAEIALACGYSEQSSLTRQFKSAVGCPPAAYRKMHR